MKKPNYYDVTSLMCALRRRTDINEEDYADMRNYVHSIKFFTNRYKINIEDVEIFLKERGLYTEDMVKWFSENKRDFNF